MLRSCALVVIAWSACVGAVGAQDRPHSEATPRAPALLDAGGPTDADAGSDAGSFADSDASTDASLSDDASAGVGSETDAGATDDAGAVAEAPSGQSPEIPALPSASPEPQIAPIVLGKDGLASPPVLVTPTERPLLVIKTILGLLGLLSLAYLASQPVVKRFERRIGVSQMITAGFPFVVLGMIVRHPAIGLLSDYVLAELSPVLRIGLGSIGFMAGFRLRAAASGTAGAGGFVAFSTLTPFVLVMLAASLLLLMFSGGTLRAAISDPVFLRDAIILGTAGAMAAKPSSEVIRSSDAAGVISRVIRLEELVGMIGLAAVTAYFRPEIAASWQLPGTAWLLITVGLGTTMSALTYLILQRAKGGPEFLLLALGSISFAAGVAGYLRLSPLVVGFIAGALLAAFPSDFQSRLGPALKRLERPIYLVSLIAIGALWKVDDWRGWALIPIFVSMRLLGKWLGTILGVRYTELSVTPEEGRALAIAPMGPLAIAIVVNAQLLYPGGSISLIVAAVIGGAILTEVAVQLAARRAGPRSPAPDGNGFESQGDALLTDRPER